MTDQDKVIKLLKELGVKFEVEGNTIYIEPFYCDGAEEFGISFWDGEDYPKGEFHEFWVVPDEDKSESEEREQQPSRCDSCIHSEERDGSNCYECVKGMSDNFEAQPTDVDCISREAMLSLQTEYAEKMGATTFWKLRDDIRALPSVTPTNADTREAYIKGYDYGVKDWFKFKTQPTHGSTYGGVSWGGIYKEEAQPTDKCKGCYYNDDEAHAECVVCDKGAQPSEDCISRSELLRHQHIIYDDDGEDYRAVYVKDIKAMPSVTPERPKGKWIVDKGIVTVLFCSECGAGTMFKSPCCPYCGAEMSGGNDE